VYGSVCGMYCTRKRTIPRRRTRTCAAVEWIESFGARRTEINGWRCHYIAFCVRAIARRFTQDILCVWASLSSGAARVFVIQLHSKMRYKKIRPGFRGRNESLFRKAGDDGTSVRLCDVIRRWRAGWGFFFKIFFYQLLPVCSLLYAIRWAVAVLLTVCNINFLTWINLIPIEPEQ